MDHTKFKSLQLRRRRKRVRKKVYGDSQRPRLSIYRSLRHIYAQLIDDDSEVTLVSASTLSEKLGDDSGNNSNAAAAAKVGEALARKALDVGIRQARFDRNGRKYHGRVRALAEAAREAGLVF